jgi:hypothetical protein
LQAVNNSCMMPCTVHLHSFQLAMLVAFSAYELITSFPALPFVMLAKQSPLVASAAPLMASAPLACAAPRLTTPVAPELASVTPASHCSQTPEHAWMQVCVP